MDLDNFLTMTCVLYTDYNDYIINSTVFVTINSTFL